MKKKLIIAIVICLMLIVGVVCLLNIRTKDKIFTTITLDINPSVEINLNKNNKVISVKALNKDAKDIVSKDLKGKSLDAAIDSITKNVIDKGYVDGDHVEVIIYSDGKVKNEEIENKIKDSFIKNEIAVDVISIKSISKEDKALAKELNISPAKAAYIKSITDENKNVKAEDLANKSVNELKETKETGRYCDSGYTLEGDWCVKEIEIIDPSEGEICPEGYMDYEGICYKEIPSNEKEDSLLCRDEFNLVGKDCIRRREIDAVVTEYTCPVGEIRTEAEVGIASWGSGPANNPVCVDSNSITRPVTVCELPASDPTERLYSGGQCYWHRAPVIESGCPGKIQVDGFCWDSAEGIYLCPNGNNNNTRTVDDYCYVVLDVLPVPNGYRCDEEDMRLEGSICVKEEKEEPEKERYCETGYTLVNHDRCIKLDDTVDKVNGLVCRGEDERLKDGKCYKYEVVEAKQN